MALDTSASRVEAKIRPKIRRENTKIDWTKSWSSIDAQVRGLSPYPGMDRLKPNGETLRIKIFEATYERASKIIH